MTCSSMLYSIDDSLSHDFCSKTAGNIDVDLDISTA